MIKLKPIIISVSIFASGLSSGFGHGAYEAYNSPERVAERQRRRDLDKKVNMIAPDLFADNIVCTLGDGRRIVLKCYGGQRFELWTDEMGFKAKGTNSELLGVEYPWGKSLTEDNCDPEIWALQTKMFEQLIVDVAEHFESDAKEKLASLSVTR